MNNSNRKHTHPLMYNVCDKCEGRIKEVVYSEEGIRRGWYCPRCQVLKPAVGRERLVEVGQ